MFFKKIGINIGISWKTFAQRLILLWLEVDLNNFLNKQFKWKKKSSKIEVDLSHFTNKHYT